MAKREMTEEQKKANAERLAKARAEKAAKRKEEEAKAKAEAVAAESTVAQAPIIQVAPKDPMVTILYIDQVIPNNQIPIGKGRFITGSGRKFSVTLSEFEGEFMTPFHMALIEKRKFIVLDGLTDEQREQYGCLYRENEIVTKNGMFDWFITASDEEAAEKFEMLCKEHKQLVARRFIDAFESKDNRIIRSKIEALNKLSKKDDANGMFTSILKAMNEASV